MPKITKSCYASKCYANYIKTIYKLMLRKMKASKRKNIKNNFDRL